MINFISEGIEMNLNKKHDIIYPQDIKIVSCKKPLFKNQKVIQEDTFLELEKDCLICAKYDVLTSDDRSQYIEKACLIERRSGMSGFGPKPRAEVCYTPNGETYRYSGKDHYTVEYPTHVKELIPKLLSQLNIDSTSYTLSNAVDIVYSNSFARGGSISAHKDDEKNWSLVIIYSLGQTRWLRIRNDLTREYTNIELRDNSLVAMIGKDFQTKCTHQIDKLSMTEKVDIRLSLNIRFLSNEEKNDS
jgi:alkylated DNA repair dioxygenase AlkB